MSFSLGKKDFYDAEVCFEFIEYLLWDENLKELIELVQLKERNPQFSSSDCEPAKKVAFVVNEILS
jgi:hypothetical protein